MALYFFPALWIQGGSEEWEPEPEYTIPHASSRSWFEWIVDSNLGGAFRPPASITQRNQDDPFEDAFEDPFEEAFGDALEDAFEDTFQDSCEEGFDDAFEDPFEEAFEEPFENVHDDACDDDRDDAPDDGFDGDPRKSVSKAQAK